MGRGCRRGPPPGLYALELPLIALDIGGAAARFRLPTPVRTVAVILLVLGVRWVSSRSRGWPGRVRRRRPPRAVTAGGAARLHPPRGGARPVAAGSGLLLAAVWLWRGGPAATCWRPSCWWPVSCTRSATSRECCSKSPPASGCGVRSVRSVHRRTVRYRWRAAAGEPAARPARDVIGPAGPHARDRQETSDAHPGIGYWAVIGMRLIGPGRCRGLACRWDPCGRRGVRRVRRLNWPAGLRRRGMRQSRRGSVRGS